MEGRKTEKLPQRECMRSPTAREEGGGGVRPGAGSGEAPVALRGSFVQPKGAAAWGGGRKAKAGGWVGRQSVMAARVQKAQCRPRRAKPNGPGRRDCVVWVLADGERTRLGERKDVRDDVVEKKRAAGERTLRTGGVALRNGWRGPCAEPPLGTVGRRLRDAAQIRGPTSASTGSQGTCSERMGERRGAATAHHASS